MSKLRLHRITAARPLLVTGAAALALFAGCVNDQTGISNPDGAGSGGELSTSGGTMPAASGSTAAGSGAQPAQGGMPGSQGQAGDDAGGAPDTHGGTGGTSSDHGGTIGGGGTGGSGGTGVVSTACTFHTDPSSSAEGGAGGDSAQPAPTVTLQLSPFVGSYLADATGRTLYTYGGDLPGDCHTPPVSQCVTDCALTWPPFDAGARVLAAGIDAQGFGSIQRADGSSQTTYRGWPLYYNKADLALGQVSGQGKGKTWHIAQLNPPAVVIMKIGTVKYLADASGHTLYVSAADHPGMGNVEPISDCSGACLQTFEPFDKTSLSVVTSLNVADFGVFARGAGGLQVAYKGAPLYRAVTDSKSGDMTGTSVTGFTAALP
jgi:predicted lipoprotein with Yx(FWY)xxD motif